MKREKRKSNRYPYTDHDLLVEPESYEYTEFRGTSFLRAYQDERETALKELEVESTDSEDPPGDDRLQRWRETIAALPGQTNSHAVDSSRTSSSPGAIEALSRPEQGKQIDTTPSLGHLARRLAVPDADRSHVAKEWLDLFVQRFEARKRLHRTYAFDGDRLQASTDEPAEIQSYPLLGIACLIYHHQHRQSLKAVNAALKLGDTLVSNMNRLRSRETKGLTRALLESELEVVWALSRQQEVEIPDTS